MIDFEGIPCPRTRRRAGCVCASSGRRPGSRSWSRSAHRKMAVFDVPLLRDLEAAIEELARTGACAGS
jgi:hypothetical protein